MQVDVTSAVWDRLLAVRRGENCCCCGTWSVGEQAALNLYGPLARRDLEPSVVAQVGQSLDGRVATIDGDARDISGPDGLAHLHRMRALADAVVIGVGTALHDLPRLTVRLCGGTNPARVIIDPHGRLPNDAPALRDDGARRVVIQTVARERPMGVQVIHLAKQDGVIQPGDIVDALQREGLRHLLIEGGGITIGRFLEADRLTRLHVAIAPLVIGGGPQGLTLANPPRRLSEASKPDVLSYALGTDTVFDCGLQPAAQNALRPRHQRP